MSGFDDIIGQQSPIRLLQTFLRNATLPHALLFTGIPGIGKRVTAKAVAMALNCRGNEDGTPVTNACGYCQPCRQITSGHHPDIISIDPQGNYLRIDQIRKLLGILAMKPYNDGYRVAIISDCQAMNLEAANALLKVLEEPPAETILILTAQNKADLLPTIVSRCRHIRFNRLNEDDLAGALTATRHVENSIVDTAAALSGGSLSRAEKYVDAKWQDQRAWLIQAAGLHQPGALEERPVSLALAFAGQLASKKDKIPDLLEMLKIWVRDLAIWPYEPNLAIHRNCGEQLSRVRNSMDDNRLLDMWAAVEKAQKDIAAKANLRLTLDIMALSMIQAVQQNHIQSGP